MQWKSWIITSMHQNTLFKKPCDFGRGVSQKYSQIIVLFNSKCQNQKQTGSRVQRIGWKQPWITHTLFGGFEYYSAFDWGNYTYKSSTKITSWPNFNHKSQVSIKIIIFLILIDFDLIDLIIKNQSISQPPKSQVDQTSITNPRLVSK